jgi:hypothetical protein
MSNPLGRQERIMAVSRKVACIWLLAAMGNTCRAEEFANADPNVQPAAAVAQWPLGGSIVEPALYAASGPAPQELSGPPAATVVGMAPPVNVAPVIDPCNKYVSGIVAPADCCDSCGWQYRACAWRIEGGLLPMDSRVTSGQFGDWLLGDTEGGVAGRFTVGYEDVSGLGMRLRIWSYDQSVPTPNNEVDIDAGTVHLDFYKRLFIENAEVVVGAGTADSRLAFVLENDTQSKFVDRGGLSAFVEGWQPLLRFTRADLGIAGRGRYSVVTGRWKDSTGFVIMPTYHDTMSITEIAFGLEFRRRFGRNLDNYWYLQWFAEHQRWDSAWMTVNAGTSVGLTGANLNLGVVF